MWVTSETDDNAYFALIYLNNKGSKDITVLTDNAFSSDYDYYSFDRDMKLINNQTAKAIKKQTIKAGQSDWVAFEFSSPTWIDNKTTYYFTIIYDGVKYRVSCSSYFGNSYLKCKKLTYS